MATPAEHLSKEHEAPPGPVPYIETIQTTQGSSEPVFISETQFGMIAQNKNLLPWQRAGQLASGFLDNISITFNSDRSLWPTDADFDLEAYNLAQYLTQTTGEDQTDILLEVIDEEIQSELVPPIYAEILKASKKFGNLLRLGERGKESIMLIRIWLALESEIDIPSAFDKMKKKAHQAQRLNDRSGFRPVRY